MSTTKEGDDDLFERVKAALLRQHWEQMLDERSKEGAARRRLPSSSWKQTAQKLILD